MLFVAFALMTLPPSMNSNSHPEALGMTQVRTNPGGIAPLGRVVALTPSGRESALPTGVPRQPDALGTQSGVKMSHAWGVLRPSYQYQSKETWRYSMPDRTFVGRGHGPRIPAQPPALEEKVRRIGKAKMHRPAQFLAVDMLKRATRQWPTDPAR